MDFSVSRLHVGYALSSMCAAALPKRSPSWRQLSEASKSMLALVGNSSSEDNERKERQAFNQAKKP
jgi:hypothetical protein